MTTVAIRRIIAANVAVAILGCGRSGIAQSGGSAPVPANRKDVVLLDETRIRLIASDRSEWLNYLARSRKQRALDSASMAGELRATGQAAMIPAPYARSFDIGNEMTPAWFASDSARVIADNLLSFQAPNGGWSKHVEYSRGPRLKGQSWFSESDRWQWISTIDNSSTTEQMRFLVLRDSVRPASRYKDAYLRGLRYLFESQMPNGCWPQVWPLDGSYHDAATFNDDAMTNVLTTLQHASEGDASFVVKAERDRARHAVDRGIECVLRAQVHQAGKLAVWGQQHDPLTLHPVRARSYEHESLSAQESANLLRFLIKQQNPSPRLAFAIRGAAAWLKASALSGYTYDYDTGLRVSPGQGPLWARMYELDTGKPIFSDRNGIRLYHWNQLKDRRTGYAWYTYAPVLALRQYDSWERRNSAPPERQ